MYYSRGLHYYAFSGTDKPKRTAGTQWNVELLAHLLHSVWEIAR